MTNWDLRFLEIAATISGWSKDPSTQVGAVCVDKHRRIASTGYNGFPVGACDSQDRLENREVKYKYVLHAEENCILNARHNLNGCTMYITHPPCLLCCGRMRQAGIERVVWISPTPDFANRWDRLSTNDYLEELGIIWSEYNRDNILYIRPTY